MLHKPKDGWNASSAAGRKILAGLLVGIPDRKAVEDTHQHLRANNLVMWEAIAWHAQKGYAKLDFGRTSRGNEGLRRFKRGWGTTEHPVTYLRVDLLTGQRVTAQDRTSGWHTTLFRHAPPAVSRWLGAVLYRHAA